jgi:shikimate kinase
MNLSGGIVTMISRGWYLTKVASEKIAPYVSPPSRPTNIRNLKRLGMMKPGNRSRASAQRLAASYDHVPEPLTRPLSRFARLLVYGTVDSIRNHSMTDGAVQKPGKNGLESAVVRALGNRSIVLVGMMGAGKSSIGRRLAVRLGIPFIDADMEIESAAGMTITEIFDKHGESYFRAGEARVIARLLDNGPQVLATGGGSVMDPQTRALIGEKGISIWLKADIDVLLKRTKRRNDRPLAEKIKDLLPAREPFYAQADIVVQSRDEPHDTIIEEIMTKIPKHLGLDAEKQL